MRHDVLHTRTEESDYLDFPELEHDWSQSVYGDIAEVIPQDSFEPLGKDVTTTHYVDPNLMHNLVTGHSVAANLHLVNKTPLDWYSKKQVTVETATYGSEFDAACTCVE
jgi:hypothetical protein